MLKNFIAILSLGLANALYINQGVKSINNPSRRLYPYFTYIIDWVPKQYNWLTDSVILCIRYYLSDVEPTLNIDYVMRGTSQCAYQLFENRD